MTYCNPMVVLKLFSVRTFVCMYRKFVNNNDGRNSSKTYLRFDRLIWYKFFKFSFQLFPLPPKYLIYQNYSKSSSETWNLLRMHGYYQCKISFHFTRVKYCCEHMGPFPQNGNWLWVMWRFQKVWMVAVTKCEVREKKRVTLTPHHYTTLHYTKL